ncbi:SRPBCC domain-containing protein [Asticcacaulis sp. YBE204]|uniref:SRPBCC family protein n=1 Tax=Asticcacaulis sp. YBE204 TaxID=1282363 RepID=UPI0003C40D62|nr:SRPBCC domain-containing protein [Asticcacaulis sp. YBE204]ESQ79999.1 hypothetical protein AEYBE204_09120 [Asticcacaulis sp. YBE204]
MSDSQNIVVDEIFPHTPDAIWKALTDGELMKRWLMPAEGFAATVGKRFTFKTTPAGQWDGTIHCEVLEVVPAARFVYSWQGGHEDNVGYGSKLDTQVTWTLTAVDGGTRVHLVHSGFVVPRNDVAFKNMGDGWKKVVQRLGSALEDQA